VVQRTIEKAGIATCMIAALPPVARQQGTPRAVAPRVPMGANAGEPNNIEMQTAILEASLKFMMEADQPGLIKELPYEYHAKI